MQDVIWINKSLRCTFLDMTLHLTKRALDELFAHLEAVVMYCWYWHHLIDLLILSYLWYHLFELAHWKYLYRLLWKYFQQLAKLILRWFPPSETECSVVMKKMLMMRCNSEVSFNWGFEYGWFHLAWAISRCFVCACFGREHLSYSFQSYEGPVMSCDVFWFNGWAWCALKLWFLTVTVSFNTVI